MKLKTGKVNSKKQYGHACDLVPPNATSTLIENHTQYAMCRI